MPVVDRLLVQSLAINQVLGADSYTSTPASNSHLFTNGLRDLILSVDGSIVTAILMNGNHGRRRDFILTAAMAHGGQLPSHIGPIDAVRIASKAATPWPLEDIERERINALGVPLHAHYAIQGTRCYSNATVSNFGVTTADVDYCDYAPDTSTFLCKAPAEYTDCELAAALEYLYGIEGDDVSAAGLYGRVKSQYIQMIAGGAMTLPPMEAIAQAA